MRSVFYSICIALSLCFSLSSHAFTNEKEKVKEDVHALTLPQGYLQNLKWNLPLDSVGKNGSVITWKSSKPEYLSDNGALLKQSSRGGKKVEVKMTATISSGKVQQKKSFPVYIAYEEPIFDGYLFAYFEGSGEKMQQEQLRFGASADAVNWYALNNNQPIIASSEISKTGGIRDPYIMRCEDEKTFYIVATDMFTHKDGWGANPGITMLSSDDLIHWKHSIIDLAKEYPAKFGNVHWVWAPQVVYDPEVSRYLVYFTIRFKNEGYLDFYCAHANDDFTGFVNEPEMMFRAKYGAIDGDIIYKDGTYHLFFKGNTKNEEGKEYKNGIQQATSKSLRGPWAEDFIYLDAYADSRTVVEGSSIFKLNNSDTYILMYDLYSNLRYEFQRSTDLYHFTKEPESFTKNFNPRHGSVISITREEAIRLNEKWGGMPEGLLSLPVHSK